jgi:hypothetical protein
MNAHEEFFNGLLKEFRLDFDIAKANEEWDKALLIWRNILALEYYAKIMNSNLKQFLRITGHEKQLKFLKEKASEMNKGLIADYARAFQEIEEKNNSDETIIFLKKKIKEQKNKL